MDKETYDSEYITELSQRSFHTAMTLEAENASDAILSTLEDELDHNISIMTVGPSSNNSSINLLKYEEL